MGREGRPRAPWSLCPECGQPAQHRRRKTLWVPVVRGLFPRTFHWWTCPTPHDYITVQVGSDTTQHVLRGELAERWADKLAPPVPPPDERRPHEQHNQLSHERGTREDAIANQILAKGARDRAEAEHTSARSTLRDWGITTVTGSGYHPGLDRQRPPTWWARAFATIPEGSHGERPDRRSTKNAARGGRHG